MSQPGGGTVMYNSAETVRQFPGMAQKAIMPPKGSPAGAAYKSAFGVAHGFNPYAAGGFVPNFAPKSSPWATVSRKRGAGNTEATYTIPANDIGVLLGYDEKRTANFDAPAKVASLAGLRNTPIGKRLAKDKARVVLRGIRAKSFQTPSAHATAEQLFSNDIQTSLRKGMGGLSKTMMRKMGIEGMPGRMGRLDPGTEGGIFEEAMRMSMKAAQATPGAAFDFEAGGKPTDAMSRIFGVPITRIDAKRRLEAAKGGEMPKKYFNDPVTSKTGIKLLKQLAAGKHGQFTKSAAAGFIPNYSPLSNAIGREMAAGVPASAIRVGSNSILRGAGNPRGLGVYNTIDEPMGLSQGIRRSKSMGVNPKTHGVPNYARRIRRPSTMEGTPGLSMSGKKADKAAVDTAEHTGRMAKIMEGMQKRPEIASMGGFAAYTALTGGTSMMGEKWAAGGRITGNIGMMAATGAAIGGAGGAGVGALPGAAIGAAVGAITSIGDIITLFSSDATKAAEQLAQAAGIISESLGKITDNVNKLGNYDSMTTEQRIEALLSLEQERTKLIAFAEKEAGKNTGASPVFRDLLKQVKESLPGAASITAKGAPSPEDLIKLRAQIDRFQAQQTAALGLQSFVQSESGGFARFGNVRHGKETQRSYFNRGLKGESQMLMSGIFGVRGATRLLQDEIENPTRPGHSKQVLGVMDFIARQLGPGLPDRPAPFAAKNPLNQFLNVLKDTGNEGLAEGFIKSMQLRQDGRGRYMFGGTDTGVGSEMAFRSMFLEGGIFGPSVRQATRAATVPTPTPEQPDLGAAVRRASKGGFSAQRMARGQARSSIDLKRQAQAANRLAAQQMQYATAIARATKDTIGLADETKKLADSEAERRFKQDMEIAKASKREAQAKAFVGARGQLTSYLRDKNLGLPEQKAVSRTLNRVLAMTPQQMEDEATRIRGIMGPKLPQDDFALTLIEATLPNFRKIGEDFKTAGDKAKDALTDSKNINKEKNEADKEALRLSRILNTEKQKEIRITQAILSKQSVSEARRRARKGQLSAKEYSRTFSGSIDDQIAAYGIDSIDGDVMGDTFRNEMAYNQVDTFRDFRSGVQEVAGTMKSSFAEAFQAMSSGATSVQGALANMAQSVLNSISQISSQMFSNMMFAKIFPGGGGFAQGGYVPGYNAGGLVTGGSGHKDDVMTRMQGGEFVIKKSAVNKIGLPTLNAINGAPGYANGGSYQSPSMWKVGAIAAGSSALSGIMNAASAPGQPDPAPSRNYGMGRSSLGYLGGADADAGQRDIVTGGGGSAGVSLGKGFIYYRRDPKTGRLISERARPTEGRFEVSDRLSLLGRLSEGDPQTARMFEKEQAMSKYQGYLATETQSRRDQIKAIKRQKRGRLIGAYMNAAMLIGGASWMDGMWGSAGATAASGISGNPPEGWTPPYNPALSTAAPSPYELGFSGGVYTPTAASSGTVKSDYTMQMSPGIGSAPYPKRPFPGNANGGLARVMGGEYIMSPQAVRTHGVGFMTELNRGNVPGYAEGGMVGGGPTLNTGGNMTNNVKINVNIDKNGGKPEVTSQASSQKQGDESRDDNTEAQNNSKLGEMLQNVVIEELVKQQRPGGLLNQQS